MLPERLVAAFLSRQAPSPKGAIIIAPMNI